MKRFPLVLLLCLAGIGLGGPLASRAADPVSPVFNYADVDTKPTPKKPVRVRFPSSVRKKGETSEIVLRFVVTKTGDVAKLTVVKFSDADMINPAMESYERAKFNPGLKNGAPVDTWMEATETVPAK